MMTRRTCILLAMTPLATGSAAVAFAPPRPTPQPPRKSLPAPGRAGRSFSSAGISKVVVRAAGVEWVSGDAVVERAEVVVVPGGRAVTISGVPKGGSEGYHPSDPNYRETPAVEWGLDFAAKVHGSTLVISTVREMSYIHHQYYWSNLKIEVPEGVEVVRENRTLSGKEGLLSPDLGPPK